MALLIAHVTEHESVSMVVIYLLGVATGGIGAWCLSAWWFQRQR